MTPYIKPIIAAVALAAAAYGGWLVNGWRHETIIATMERDTANALSAANERYRAKEQTWQFQLSEAQDAAKKRETKLLADATAARSAAGSLRDDLAAIRRDLPGLAADACREQADRLADVFGACVGEYRDMAEEADRINSGRQELMDAWPKY